MNLLENEWFIEAPWGRISIIAWGNCLDPPVLVCHGAVDSAASFRPLINLLPTNFYYIGMEIPGNGKSDPFLPGMMINLYDLVYVIKRIVDHFRWERFDYIAHSLGTKIGKFYNMCCPGKMCKVIELDPTPLSHSVIQPKDFSMWYEHYFKNYDKYNSSRETAPAVDKDEALWKLKNQRGLTDELANMILERISEPAGDGMIRFTFDQRMKFTITPPPLPSHHVAKLYTDLPNPTLVLISAISVKRGSYNRALFMLDESAYPAKNCRVIRITGNHDFHVIHPERIASFITQFLLYGLNGFTFDQRTKISTSPPLSSNFAAQLFTSIPNPTLTIISKISEKYGAYYLLPFVLDENAYPAKNCRVIRITGNHDVHVIHPERIAPFITQFLLYGLNGLDVKAKL